MATYAIGDVQGCYMPLQALLTYIGFDAGRDRLWFTGDLVNRGPQSAEVLRYVMALGDRAVSVLGNHDLHLLAVAAGHGRAHHNDTLADILTAPDRDALLDWLRHRPLFHHDPELGYALVHAGLLPQWSLAKAALLAREVEDVLRQDEHGEFFARMYGNVPDHWEEDLGGWERLRLITNVFTRLRYCDTQGHMDFHSKGAPGSQSPGTLPWFEHPLQLESGQRVVFGHWSTLPTGQYGRVVALDGGCLWGGAMTAARLDSSAPRLQAVACPQLQAP